MKQYISNLKQILNDGEKRLNRTGIETLSVSGTFAKFKMRDGFPLVTTKQMTTKAIVGELIGFLRGYDNAEDFQKLGCNIWNANANDTLDWLASPFRKGNNDLGRIYGVQWRKRRDFKISTSFKTSSYLSADYTAVGEFQDSSIFFREFDQLDSIIAQIRDNSTSRRIIMNAWNPNEDDEMALPPYHCSYHFIVADQYLDLCMHQRSADYFLGVPFNIASASLLLYIIAKVTDKIPRYFTHFMDDSHIYVNHTDQVKTQIEREPLSLCELKIDDSDWDLSSTDALVASIKPEHFKFLSYKSHSKLKGEMAI